MFFAYDPCPQICNQGVSWSIWFHLWAPCSVRVVSFLGILSMPAEPQIWFEIFVGCEHVAPPVLGRMSPNGTQIQVAFKPILWAVAVVVEQLVEPHFTSGSIENEGLCWPSRASSSCRTNIFRDWENTCKRTKSIMQQHSIKTKLMKLHQVYCWFALSWLESTSWFQVVPILSTRKVLWKSLLQMQCICTLTTNVSMMMGPSAVLYESVSWWLQFNPKRVLRSVYWTASFCYVEVFWHGWEHPQ